MISPEVKMISIVLPVRNQADHIARVVEEHNELLMGSLANRFEIILVVNACVDETRSICQDLAARLDPIRLLDSDVPGWGAAVKLGISAAVGEVICVASSARERSSTLLEFIEFALANPDAVVQARRSARLHWIRRLGSSTYNWQCRTLFGLDTQDINGTPKVFSRSFARLLTLKEDSYLIDLEFNVVCKESGYPVIELPVQQMTRHGGKTMTTYWSAIVLGLQALRYRLNKRQTMTPTATTHNACRLQDDR